MIVLRPIAEQDLESLTELVGTIGDGLTTLPNDPKFLEHRIHDSLRAFYPEIKKPGGEYYLFVLEDTAKDKIVGTSGILARVGGFDPFYTYKIVRESQEYAPLGIATSADMLHLQKNHKGPTEICSLFLHPDYRSGGFGRLLSKSRFLFIRNFPERFETNLIAELRGFIAEDGTSPFWEAVGKTFFQKDYYTADILSGLGEKDFIEALMPRYPIYIPLLPPSAQAVIGKVHPHTEPALHLLKKEGFTLTDEVDIFDAGPLVRARRDRIHTWKQTRKIRFKITDALPAETPIALLAKPSIEFRATLGAARPISPDEIEITQETASLLQLETNQSILHAPLQ